MVYIYAVILWQFEHTKTMSFSIVTESFVSFETGSCDVLR